MDRFVFLLFILLFFACQPDIPEQASLFQLKSGDHTGVRFQNTLEETEAFNIIQYLYFYNGGGVAIGDVNQDGLPDLFFTANQGADELYLNQGDFRFAKADDSWGISNQPEWSTGVSMVDINADGLLDVYVCVVSAYRGLKGKNKLYINTGQNRFEERAAAYGLDFEGFSTHSAFFDYDRDGDLDLYLLRHSVHSPGSYRDTSARLEVDSLAGDLLLRNDGERFTDVTQEAGIFSGKIGYGLGVAVGDINGDDWPDLYISNDFHENDFLYINQQDGTFEEEIRTAIGHSSQFSMGNELADLNNDGRPEILTLDMRPADEVIFKQSAGAESYDLFDFKAGFGYHYQLPRNHLQLNRTTEADQLQFVDIAPFALMESTDWSWSILAQDFDLDGWKDLYISNGIVRRPNDLDYLKFIADPLIQQKATDLQLASKMPEGILSNVAFKNQAGMHFSDQTQAWGLDTLSLSNGAAYGDLDLDGDLDLVVNNINAPAFIWENRASEQSAYLKIRLKGSGQNPFGIGSRVELFLDGKQQTQELHLSRGFQSSVSPEIVFGLGQSTKVDSLIVKWPDGRRSFLRDVSVNQTLLLDQSEAVAKKEKPSIFKQGAQKEDVFPYWKHREDHYLDLNDEKLMPYALSAEGPAMAVADVNGDQLDDIFLGGATGQGSSLFFQKNDGTFEKVNAPFAAHAQAEDVTAHFFDANGDGMLDLYVGAGGHQPSQRDFWQDRLYLQRNGAWEYQAAALPLLQQTTGAVASLDVDRDGDLDLFVGTRVHTEGYGLRPTNYLLINQGNGAFEMDASFKIEGMVTSAIVGQWDGLAASQLILAGEWMPVCHLKWENGALSITPIAPEGLWQALYSGDWDQDGDEDILAGNFGLNSLLRTHEDKPIRLYVKDFDRNTRIDPILTHYRGEKEYPFAGKDELIQQLVILRRIFSNYRLFSESPFSNLFPPAVMEGVDTLKVESLSSLYLQNDGSGNFKTFPLPVEAQLGPIRSIESVDSQTVFICGSRNRIQPSIGRQDALMQPVLLQWKDDRWEVQLTDFRKIERLKAFQAKEGKRYLLLGENGQLTIGAL